MTPHLNHLNKTVQMRGHNIWFSMRNNKYYHQILPLIWSSNYIRLTSASHRGWSGGAIVLGKLPVSGRPTVWMIVGQGPIALAVGVHGGYLDIFTLLYAFSPLSPSLREMDQYRLKYCLKGLLNLKQPTNQLLVIYQANMELFGFTMQQCVPKMQMEWQTVYALIRLLQWDQDDLDLYCVFVFFIM